MSKPRLKATKKKPTKKKHKKKNNSQIKVKIMEKEPKYDELVQGID